MLEKRVASQGIFPGAVVMRGADWHWGDQDGKETNTVSHLHD